MNLGSIIIAFGGALFGFFLKLIHGRIYDKKVLLRHHLENPSVFTVPKKTTFQHLRIWNKGNEVAKELRVSLNKSLIDESKAEYKPNIGEIYEEEIRDNILTLKFPRLRPKEQIAISFLSEEPISEDVLLSVKSDEIVSVSDETVEEHSPSRLFIVGGTVFLVFLGIIGLLSLLDWLTLGRSVPPWPLGKRSIVVSMSPNSLTCKKGEEIEIEFVLENKTSDILTNVQLILTIAGVWTELPSQKFISGGETIRYNRTIFVPKEIPAGDYKITAIAESSSFTFLGKAEGKLTVR